MIYYISKPWTVLITSTTRDLVLLAMCAMIAERFSRKFIVKEEILIIKRLMLSALITFISAGIIIGICAIIDELLLLTFSVKKELINIEHSVPWSFITSTMGGMYSIGIAIAICITIAELFSYEFLVKKERHVMQKDSHASYRMLDVLKGLGVTSKRLNHWVVHHPNTVSCRTQQVTNEALDRCGVFYTIRNIGGYSDGVARLVLCANGLYPDALVIKAVLYGLKRLGDRWVENKSVFDVHQRMPVLLREMNALNHVYVRCEQFLLRS